MATPVGPLDRGVLGIAWLWERSRSLHSPHYDQVDFVSDVESVLTWSPADLRLPGLLSASQRWEMVWGVQRFESERTTSLLDVPATVRGSAKAGFPKLHFACAHYEHEVWPWDWQQLPEIAREPAGITRQRLLCMGFAGAEPGGRKSLGGLVITPGTPATPIIPRNP